MQIHAWSEMGTTNNEETYRVLTLNLTELMNNTAKYPSNPVRFLFLSCPLRAYHVFVIHSNFI